jgi:flagellar hook assembly protein FlgD
MNIQNLVGLTTQNKASDFLAKSVPSNPQLGLTQNLTETAASAALKDGEATETTDTTDTTASLLDNVATDSNDRGEEFNTFLTLLTAQIRNQDPLAPLDSTQFVEQLATFTNLELQANGNASLERIENMLAQDQLRQAQIESSDST